MKYLLIYLALFVSTIPAWGGTLQEKLDELNAKPGVIEARAARSAQSVSGFGEIYSATIVWYYEEGDVIKKASQEMIITELGTPQESAYWLNEIPGPLKPAPADAYITGRNTPFTKAQVEAFCNAQWKATAGNAAARDVIEFTVTNVTANTIRVTGLFHDVETNNRLSLTYLISLVDANGATSGANVKFEKVIE